MFSYIYIPLLLANQKTVYFRYAIFLIAMYNVWDLIGRNIPLIECVKLESRKGLKIAVLARFFLIPAFYFTAKYADQGWMIFLTSFLGLTNGYLTVCVLTSAPKGYKVCFFHANKMIFITVLDWKKVHHSYKIWKHNAHWQNTYKIIS